MVIENSWYQTNSPKQLATTLFPPTIHYPPKNIQKTRTCYEFILVDTDSVEIWHNKDQEEKILFSKLKINKVMFPQEWNQPLYIDKSFSRSFSPQTYNYYDYINAWSHLLFLNPDSHSWFLWFKRGISLKFPKWFVKWFLDYGPNPSIFPDLVIDIYDYFKQNSTFVPGY